MTRPFVLSIRPTFIERILSGHKTVELRRRFPILLTRARVLLYSTSPVQSIVAFARLDSVIQLPVRQLWRQFGDASAVTRQEFETYFEGTNSGCALTLGAVRQFERPIHLTHLERQFEFSPPQSYCYWKESLLPLATHGRVKAFT